MDWKRLQDRLANKHTQIFKIQTQIRAELNNLRKTYHDNENLKQRTNRRKQFPQILYKQTLKLPDPRLQQNRLLSQTKTPDRGKKRISPINIPERLSTSPLQRKHFPNKYSDNVRLQFKRTKRPSAYLVNRQGSPTPERRSKSILGFVDEKNLSKQRPSKKIISKMHTFTQNFF